MTISLLGIDLAKDVFHIHGVDKFGREVVKKRVYRSDLLDFVSRLPSTRIVLEACGGSNYWSREFEKFGHRVELIAPQYVKPFVKRNKNDWKDAEAICTAASQSNMRYVPKRSEHQQDIQNLHRIRQRLVKSRTALVNEARGFLHEYGIVIPKGRRTFAKMYPEVMLKEGERLSELARTTLYELWQEYLSIDKRIRAYEAKLKRIAKETPVCELLMQVPGIGFLTATGLFAAVGDINVFKNGRELAAWLGLTPREHSTGGKQRLLGISKRGDTYLRTLLIHGARVSLRFIKNHNDRRSVWATNLLERKGTNRTAVALANKNARVAWALMKNHQSYKEFPLAA